MTVHTHCYIRRRTMAGRLFEGCSCGRSRSARMTDEEAAVASMEQGRRTLAFAVSAFKRLYGPHIVDMMPAPASMLRYLPPAIRPASCEIPPALMAEALAHGEKYV